MAKYIDADRLRAEIENLIEEYSSIKAKGVLQKGYKGGRLIGYEDALNKLDSLQQKQPEQPTRGYDEAYLNEKIAKATKSWKGVDVDKFMDEVRGREPDKSLEEEVKNYFQGYWPGTETAEQCNTDLHFTPLAILRLARHFVEWQKEQDDNLLNIAYMDGLQRGKEAEREQMMKEAVEGEIVDSGFDDGTAILRAIVPDRRYDSGDKVRIIVLPKEDEK